MKSHLEARVEAVNKVNAEANRLLPLYRDAFAPLVGKKIFKVNGELMEKYKPILPVCPFPQFRIWRIKSNYSFGYQISTDVSYGNSTCTYAEASVYIGDLSGDTLSNLTDIQLQRCDYTVEEILNKRKVLEDTRKAFQKAESDLFPFGHYDR